MTGPIEHPDEEHDTSETHHHLVCGCYGLFIGIMGIVFPIANNLTADGPHDQALINIFHTVISCMGILFMLYLALFFATKVGCKTIGQHENQYDFEKREGAPVLWNPKGIGLFVRMGAVFFGVATVAMNVLRLIGECRGLLFYINYASYTAFVILQTFILLKYHKACIGKHRFFMRLGFVHSVVINLSEWAYIVSIEVTETLIHKFNQHENDHSDDQTNYTNGGGEDTHSIHKRAAGASFDPPGGCKFQDSLQFKAAPYLLPGIIEYSLIMAAIAYALYNGVGKVPLGRDHEHVDRGKQSARKICTYIVSIVLGLTCLAGSIVCVIYIFKKTNDVAIKTFYITETVFNIVGVIGIISGLFFMKKMAKKEMHEPLDKYLLLIGFFGYLIVDIFTAIPSVEMYDSASLTVSLLMLLRTVSSMVQSLVQVFFILDAMGRCAQNREHAKQMPGRSVVLFLIFLNIGLWLMSVFELKMETYVHILDDYYGALPWTLIESLCLPLLIFFRFHSCVCLAEIYSESYNYHPRPHTE